jgi:hypothetical protein
LILEQSGPQYKSLCRTIAEQLATLLPDCAPGDQQRLTWAIGRLSGKLFGTSPRSSPLETTADEIAAAMAWMRPAEKPRLRPPYPTPPVLTWRAVTVERQLERDLLAELTRGWDAADRASDRWLAAGLACTPRLRALLNPGQRRPNYAALTAAFVIVAETNDRAARRELELWREAAEQPAWVRALAYTVLGCQDAQRGRWDSGWPAGLDLGDVPTLESGRPGWAHFGRVLAAGGAGMLERLASFTPSPLTRDQKTKLLDAAKAAVDMAHSQTSPQ